MMTKETLLIGVLLAIVAAYPLVMRLLALVVQPRRLEMARLGRLLVNDRRLGKDHAHYVNSMLEDAYDPRVAMILVITFPVFVVRRALGLIPSQNLVEGLDADLKVSLHKLAFSHALVIGAANPAFFILFIIEIMVVSAIKAVWAIFSESGGGNSVVEMSYAAARIGALSRHLHA